MSASSEDDFAAFEEARRRNAAGFFVPGAPLFVARAPGRLDVMGGIADYSGSLVAEMPIAQAALAGVQAGQTEDGAVHVRSLDADAAGLEPEARLPGELFINPVSLLKFLKDAPPASRWFGYVAGCLALLRADGLIPRGVGARILLRSEVPLGAGVSSSAAIEVATMRALCAAFGIALDGLTLARLCQRVENEIVDAPCGIMDQVTCALGEEGTLLRLLCQPHTVQGKVALPAGWSVFGIDSGVKHRVGGSAYTRVRVAAFMGYKMLAERAGTGFGGYLCNAGPERYAALTAADPLPESIDGAAFLARHGGILDTLTRVDPAEVYPVRAATVHPIAEHARVMRFVACLEDGGEAAMAEAGQRMGESHRSYSACGLGSPETDLLAALAGADPAVAGAKITGGGSGGTVCLLCRADAEERLAQSIARAYAERTGIAPRLIRGTSPGAFATPVRQAAA